MVATGFGFISLYPIQELKVHHKELVLPLHRIKMEWDDISQPIYDRGFDWMVILCDLEYLLIRLPQDPSSPPRIVTLGRDAGDGSGWVSGLTRGDAVFAMCHGSTAKIITYSWDVEMTTHCVSRMKQFKIPGNTDCSRRPFNTGIDMASGRLMFSDHQRKCIVFDTVPPIDPVYNTTAIV